MGDRQIGIELAELIRHPAVEEANKIAFDRYLEANPVLEDIGPAKDVIPDLGDRTLLHAGPPIDWTNMCGPVKGAIAGAIFYEKWADSIEDAFKLADEGSINFDSCHHHGSVGPMAGIISPSMPVWIVQNSMHGNKAFCTLNEGLGKVLRFGANDTEVISRLQWIQKELAPVLKEALEISGGIELKPLIAQALHMGDEVHNRNVAASSLLIKKLIPFALKGGSNPDKISDAINFIAGNDHFFLNISMAACKCMLDSAHGVANSSMVSAMARNGVEFGIRISGIQDQWFTAKAPVVDGLYFPGYSNSDAAADLGDSAITETAGLGGFAMAASPAIVQFVGGLANDALNYTRQMRNITLGANNTFTIPALDFLGTSAGIDTRQVVDTGIQPIINTGIAHKEAGIGQIGAGVTTAPLQCFTQAVHALHAKLIAQ